MDSEHPLNADDADKVAYYKNLFANAILYVECKKDHTVWVYFEPSAKKQLDELDGTFAVATPPDEKGDGKENGAKGGDTGHDNPVNADKGANNMGVDTITIRHPELKLEKDFPFIRRDTRSFDGGTMQKAPELRALEELHDEGRIISFHANILEDVFPKVEDALHAALMLNRKDVVEAALRTDHAPMAVEAKPLLTVTTDALQTESRKVVPELLASVQKRLREGPADMGGGGRSM